MVDLLLAQRLVKHCVTPQLHVRRRLVVLWSSSAVLPLLGLVSAAAIVAVHSAGVGLFVTYNAADGGLQEHTTGLWLLRLSTAWLLVGNILAALAVLVVVLKPDNLRSRWRRSVPRLATKLAEFFAGAILLSIGQGVQVRAMFQPVSPLDARVVSPVAGLLLDLVLVGLYALTNSDTLFAVPGDTPTLAAKSRDFDTDTFARPWPELRTVQGIGPADLPRVYRSSSRKTGGITVRQSIEVVFG